MFSLQETSYGTSPANYNIYMYNSFRLQQLKREANLMHVLFDGQCKPVLAHH